MVVKRAAGLKPEITRRGALLVVDFPRTGAVAASPPILEHGAAGARDRGGLAAARFHAPRPPTSRRQARDPAARAGAGRCRRLRAGPGRAGLARVAGRDLDAPGRRPDRRQAVRRPPHLARLQGRRHRRRAAPGRRGLGPQRDRRRRGEGQGHHPSDRRALGPGPRRDPADQGPRLHARGQRAAHRERRRALEGRGGAAPGAPRQGEARRPGREAPAGELREGQRHLVDGPAAAHGPRHGEHRQAHEHADHQGHRLGDRRGHGADQGDRHPDAAGDDRVEDRRGDPRLRARVRRDLGLRREPADDRPDRQRRLHSTPNNNAAVHQPDRRDQSASTTSAPSSWTRS